MLAVCFVSMMSMVSAAAAEVKPANLMVSIDASSGQLVPMGEGRYWLRLETDARRIAARSIQKRGLLGGRPVAFRQKSRSYVSNWRNVFDGQSRSAVLSVPGDGGGALALDLRLPRFNREDQVLSFIATTRNRMGKSFGGFESRQVEELPSKFTDSSLKINDNGWVKLWAHLNAYYPHGDCQGDYTDPVFSCFGRGEGGGMSPWRGNVSFGSFRGGMDFWAAGEQPLEGFLPSNGKLIGEQAWGWRSDALVITDKSYYEIPDGGCKRHPASGTDKSIVGQPGGAVHVDLREGGSFITGYGYILDVQGYVSEPYFDQAHC